MAAFFVKFLHGTPVLYLNCQSQDGTLVGGDVAAFGHAEVHEALMKLPRNDVDRPWRKVEAVPQQDR